MIWVAYATPEKQFHLAVPFQPGMTALDAIQQSGIREQVELPTVISGHFWRAFARSSAAIGSRGSGGNLPSTDHQS